MYVSEYVHICRCLWVPEAWDPPGTGVAGSELPVMGAGDPTLVLHEYYVFLASETDAQPKLSGILKT